MYSRLIKINNLLNTGSMIFLYGPGVNDSYINHNLEEMDFKSALASTLAQAGYSNLVFSTPSKILDFIDDQNREVFYNSCETPSRNIALPQMEGPLGKLNIFVKPDGNLPQTAGDIHTLKMFDEFIHRADSEKKAIIILNAEAWVQFFDDPRILSGFFSKWINLPTSNPNKIFLVFSAPDTLNLKGSIPNLPVPEIRYFAENYLLTENASTDRRIDYPDEDELFRLIQSQESKFTFPEDTEFNNKLLGWMKFENISLRQWIKRFDEKNSLDPGTIQSAGWFSAIRDQNSSAESKLEKLIGLQEIKKRIIELHNFLSSRKLVNSSEDQFPLLHMVFSGNPGTGKTTVARLIGELFHEIGLMKRGHLIEAAISDLVGESVGTTPSKVNRMVDRALDGILFIDEAYMLSEADRGGFGREAIDTLISRMENDRDRLVIIFAGYPEKMDVFIRSNPGLSRRIPEMNRFNFPDMTAEELFQVFNLRCMDRELIYDQNFCVMIQSVLNYLVDHKNPNFGNAGEIRNLIDQLEMNAATRETQAGIQLRKLDVEDIPEIFRKLIGLSPLSPLEILQELENFEGLNQIQDYLEQLSSRLIVENQRKLVDPNYSGKIPKLNFVFLGNPGTGKTTVARLLGKILFSAGVIKTSRVIEVSRGDLVAGFVGQSALKTQEVIESALDGILFIDEAYSLTAFSGNDYSSEVISTLIKAIDRYSNRLIVILAGYPDEMKKFLHSNPGLNSRFPNQINFPDFDDQGLLNILLKLIQLEHFELSPTAFTEVQQRLLNYKLLEGKYFGNARSVHSFFEQIKDRLAHRLLITYKKANRIPNDELSLITEADLPSFKEQYSVDLKLFDRTIKN